MIGTSAEALAGGRVVDGALIPPSICHFRNRVTRHMQRGCDVSLALFRQAGRLYTGGFMAYMVLTMNELECIINLQVL